MIRPCTPDDAEAVCAIYNPYIAETTISYEDDPVTTDDMRTRISAVLKTGYPWLGWVEEGRLLGYSYATQFRERAAFRHSAEVSIYVAKDCHGRSIGRRLYEALFESLESKDIHMVFAGISLPNEVSIKLHEGLGFKKVAHYPEIGRKFDRWLDLGFWARPMKL